MVPEIFITDRFEAGRILASPELGGALRYVISIGDPGEDSPGALTGHAARALRLEFHDIDVEPSGLWANLYQPPRLDDVARLLAFLGDIDGPTLIHCHAGLSRSPAAALLLVALHLGPGEERAAVRYLKRIRPQAWPNRRIVAFGDDLLDLRGRLVDALAERW